MNCLPGDGWHCRAYFLNNLDGNKTMERNNSKTPSTAMPTNRNGNEINQING